MPDVTFLNNVPDPLIAGKELPHFTFALEKSVGKVIGGSSGKEATVEQLPISKGIAGVSMRSSPARCASCTGTQPPPSGPLCLKGGTQHHHPAGWARRDE